MRVCEINSCRSALLGVTRKDERQTFFDKHAGGEGKTLGNNKFTRILLLIVFVKNADIFFHNELQISNKPSVVFNFVYFFICFSVFLISFSIENNCFVINA